VSDGAPHQIADDLRRARRLAYWTVGWMLSVIAIVGLTVGSSQAMRTAWLEDVLSLIPAMAFLIALHFEGRTPTPKFPYGFLRMNGVAFMISAVALCSMGAFLLVEAIGTLVKQDAVTIAPVQIFGSHVWMGWLMMAALLYSVVPPVLLARKKLPIAERLQDKVLHTDAMMQKADWMTGLAGCAGILGVGFGFWWADAVAAGVISFSILHDGVGALRSASAELIDGAPRSLGTSEIADDAQALQDALSQRYPGAAIRMRETGRFIQMEVSGVTPPPALELDDLCLGALERRWRLAAVSFTPPAADARPDGAASIAKPAGTPGAPTP
jgi:cation diffusion facilitator family transporter